MRIGHGSGGFAQLLAVTAALAPGPLRLLVIECGQPARCQRRGKGKSDPIDAHLAVLAGLRMDISQVPQLRADGDRKALRILLGTRQEITVASTAQASRLRALLLAGDEADRQAARAALTTTALQTLAQRAAHAAGRDHAVRQAEIRRLALAPGQARRDRTDNLAQLADISEDIAPGPAKRYASDRSALPRPS